MKTKKTTRSVRFSEDEERFLQKRKQLGVPFSVSISQGIKLLGMLDNPKMQTEYAQLLSKLNATPTTVGKKLREFTWAGKSVCEIDQENYPKRPFPRKH